MTSSAWALQAAVKAALAEEAGLIALIGDPPAVYDRVPEGTVLPYVSFGEWNTDESDTDDARIDNHVFHIDAWSNYAGLKEAKRIAGIVEFALHGAALTLEDHVLIDLSFIGAAYAQDAAAGVARATLRFRAMTQSE